MSPALIWLRLPGYLHQLGNLSGPSPLQKHLSSASSSARCSDPGHDRNVHTVLLFSPAMTSQQESQSKDSDSDADATKTTRTPSVKPFHGRRDEDFQLFILRLESSLEEKRLTRVCSLKAEDTAIVTSWDDAKRERRQAKARNAIISALGDAPLRVVRAERDPAKMMQLLRDRYLSSLTSNKINLITQLFTKKFPPHSHAVVEHIDEYDALFAQLSSVGLELQEEIKCGALLVSLAEHPQYMITVEAIKTSTSTLRWDTVTTHLIDHFHSLKGTSSTAKVNVVHQGGKWRGRGKNKKGGGYSSGGGGSGSDRRPNCPICGSKWHNIEQCPATKRGGSGQGKKTERASIAYAAIHRVAHAKCNRRRKIFHDKSLYVDSGATRHICRDLDMMENVQELPKGYTVQVADDRELAAKAIGEVVVPCDHQNLRLRRVWYVPEMGLNLVSVHRLTKSKIEVRFDEDHVDLHDKLEKNVPRILRGFKHPNKLWKLGAVTDADRKEWSLAVEANDVDMDSDDSEREPMAVDDKEKLAKAPGVKPDKERMAKELARLRSEGMRWHHRLGHLNFRDLLKLSKDGLIPSIIIPDDTSEPCPICQLANSKRRSMKGQLEEPKSPGELVSADLVGPLSITGRGSMRYILTLIDHKSRMLWTYALSSKSQAAQSVIEWIKYFQKQTGLKVQKLRSDQGSEFNVIRGFLDQNGIEWLRIPAHTPELNAVVEVAQRTLLMRIRALLIQANLKGSFWTEALIAARNIMNSSPHTALNGDSPFFTLNGIQPDLKHLRAFGSLCYVRELTHQKKLDHRSHVCILLASLPHRIYRVYNPQTRRVTEETHVVIAEGHYKEAELGAVDLDADPNAQLENLQDSNPVEAILTPQQVEAADQDEGHDPKPPPSSQLPSSEPRSGPPAHPTDQPSTSQAAPPAQPTAPNQPRQIMTRSRWQDQTTAHDPASQITGHGQPGQAPGTQPPVTPHSASLVPDSTHASGPSPITAGASAPPAVQPGTMQSAPGIAPAAAIGTSTTTPITQTNAAPTTHAPPTAVGLPAGHPIQQRDALRNLLLPSAGQQSQPQPQPRQPSASMPASATAGQISGAQAQAQTGHQAQPQPPNTLRQILLGPSGSVSNANPTAQPTPSSTSTPQHGHGVGQAEEGGVSGGKPAEGIDSLVERMSKISFGDIFAEPQEQEPVPTPTHKDHDSFKGWRLVSGSDTESDSADSDSDKPSIWTKRTYGARVMAVRSVQGRLSDLPDPVSVEEAFARPDAECWKQAIKKELKNCSDHGTWTMVNRPRKGRIIRSRFVLHLKKNEQGDPVRYKARLVAQGCAQPLTVIRYSPVVHLDVVRSLLVLAHRYNMLVYQADVRGAYLNAPLDGSTVLIEPPKGMDAPKAKVLKLNRALYGLRQSGRLWYQKLCQDLNSIGMKRCLMDKCLFYRRSKYGLVLLAAFVDDLLIVGSSERALQEIAKDLKRLYEFGTFQELDEFLGMKIHRTADGFVLDQRGYVRQILLRAGMNECRPVYTPMEDYKAMQKWEESTTDVVATSDFRTLVGSILYLMTRSKPDLGFVCSYLSTKVSAPSSRDWRVLKRCLRYIKATEDFVLCLRGSDADMSLKTYVDSDFASTAFDRRSVSGQVTLLAGGCVSWKARVQDTVALANSEAEYIAAAEGMRTLRHLSQVLFEVNVFNEMPVLLEDCAASVKWLEGEGTSRKKHVDVAYRGVESLIEAGKAALDQVASAEQLADAFTKPYGPGAMLEFTRKLGLIKHK